MKKAYFYYYSKDGAIVITGTDESGYHCADRYYFYTLKEIKQELRARGVKNYSRIKKLYK
jgi:hypothetical protein